MLVLSRKLGQSFHVGPEVRVTIVKIDRNSIRIGIEAPDDVSVQREEIAFEVPRASPAQGRGRLIELGSRLHSVAIAWVGPSWVDRVCLHREA